MQAFLGFCPHSFPTNVCWNEQPLLFMETVQSEAVFQLLVNLCLLLLPGKWNDALMCKTFDIRELKPYQREANIPVCAKESWCSCKSSNWMCKVADLSSITVFDSIFEATSHVVVVASPLVNLFKDQVDKLANLEILSTSICGNQWRKCRECTVW